MASPGLRPGGAPGGFPRLSPSLLPSHREAGHAGRGPQFHRPRPCQSPDSLFLSSSAQEPVRKPQNTELQEAAGEVKEVGAPGHSVFSASCNPSAGPRIPDPKFLPSATPLRVLSISYQRTAAPPGCGEHEERMLEK